jgi:hypothetical protein
LKVDFCICTDFFTTLCLLKLEKVCVLKNWDVQNKKINKQSQIRWAKMFAIENYFQKQLCYSTCIKHVLLVWPNHVCYILNILPAYIFVICKLHFINPFMLHKLWNVTPSITVSLLQFCAWCYLKTSRHYFRGIFPLLLCTTDKNFSLYQMIAFHS